jgi:phosphohistidine phosphatase
LNGILPALASDPTVEIEQDLYGASGPRLLARLKRLGADVPSVLVIGHNPGMHSLTSMLTGAGDPELRGRLATAFPTGALATFAFDGSWADLAPGTATLEAFVVPRELL